ncbi:MAG: hypothetical protein FIA95_12700 [Gemmatimonadetes bacterium]|nr:hypothetical protein [Gemmatimonadota bacterium]
MIAAAALCLALLLRAPGGGFGPSQPSLPVHPEVPPSWPVLLSAIPALVAGVGALRVGRGRRHPAPAGAAPPSDGRSSLRDALASVHVDPGAAAVAAAWAVRKHPRVTALGVRDAHTSAEALALAAKLAVPLGALLSLSDGVKYGGHRPSADEVLRAVAPLRGVLDHD